MTQSFPPGPEGLPLRSPSPCPCSPLHSTLQKCSEPPFPAWGLSLRKAHLVHTNSGVSSHHQGLPRSHPGGPPQELSSLPPPGVSSTHPLQGLPTPFLRCLSQRLLDRVVRRYAEVADAGSIFMDHFTDRDKLRLLYTLAVNAHPILLQVCRDPPPPGRGFVSGSKGATLGLALFPFTASLGATSWR